MCLATERRLDLSEIQGQLARDHHLTSPDICDALPVPLAVVAARRSTLMVRFRRPGENQVVRLTSLGMLGNRFSRRSPKM